MLVAEQLHHVNEQIQAIDAEFSSLTSVSPHEIHHDPNFARSNEPAAAETAEMTVFQLNARLKELDSASQHLNELWLVNSMCKELDVLLDPLSTGDHVCDLDELSAVVDNTKKLAAKLQQLSASNLVIAPLLQDRYDGLVQKSTAMMVRALLLFVPEPADSTYTVASVVEINESEVTLDVFLAVARDFETFTASNEVSNVLSSRRDAWERQLLEPLIAKSISLQSNDSDTTNTTENITVSVVPNDSFSLDRYISSIATFVAFVNVTGQQSFKNYYATKVSNSLVDRISENIQGFMAQEEELTQKLMDLMDLLSRSSWSTPIRNVFMSSKNIHDSIRQLHLDWTTDKYIDLVRGVFKEPGFSESVATLTDDVIEIEIPQVPEPQPEPQYSAPPPDTVSEEIDWNDDWGSDTEDEKEPEGQDWDDWDDNWDSDEDHPPKAAKKAEPQKAAPEPPTAAPTAVPKTTAPKTKSYSIKKSAVSTQLSELIGRFRAETDGADCQVLYEAILSLATVSYPPLTESFVLLNDLRSIDKQSQYLSTSADDEWTFCRQELFLKVTGIVAKANLASNDDGEVDALEAMGRNTDELDHIVQSLYKTQLESTNAYEFKTLIVQLLNLLNTLVLETITGCDEITEYQSEKFTRYLENLQFIQTAALDHFGEDKSVLVTHNKVIQALFLINNHLKSIMEYFYQGELYEFTTDELIGVIKSVFIASDLRENCIQEIIDIRNS